MIMAFQAKSKDFILVHETQDYLASAYLPNFFCAFCLLIILYPHWHIFTSQTCQTYSQFYYLPFPLPIIYPPLVLHISDLHYIPREVFRDHSRLPLFWLLSGWFTLFFLHFYYNCQFIYLIVYFLFHSIRILVP